MDAKNLVLYRREGAYIPRVAAVHDLCGYGKCSLGIAIPVLSAAGCDVCPVPTSLFSAHTKFPTFYMHDTTPILGDYLDAWAKEALSLMPSIQGSWDLRRRWASFNGCTVSTQRHCAWLTR